MSVVIGPQLRAGSIAARALEHGGRSYSRSMVNVDNQNNPMVNRRAKGRRISRAQRAHYQRRFKRYRKTAQRGRRMITFYVKPRPYMNPALIKSLATATRAWKDILHRVR